MKMSVLQEINQNVRNMKPLEYSILAGRLSQIKEELRQVMLDVYMGDPHKGGVKPLSFVRQVICNPSGITQAVLKVHIQVNSSSFD